MTALPLTIQQEVSDLSTAKWQVMATREMAPCMPGCHGMPSSGLLCAGSQLDGKGRTMVAEIWCTLFLLRLMIKRCEGNKQDGK